MPTFTQRHGTAPWTATAYQKYRKLDSSDARCEICGHTAEQLQAVAEEFSDGLTPRQVTARATLQLDHCHIHNLIRGWLCPADNTRFQHIETGGYWGTHRDLITPAMLAHFRNCPRCVLPPLPVTGLHARHGVTCHDHHCQRCAAIAAVTGRERLGPSDWVRIAAVILQHRTGTEDPESIAAWLRRQRLVPDCTDDYVRNVLARKLKRTPPHGSARAALVAAYLTAAH